MKRITVFCGSSLGTESMYEEQAYALGKYLAEQNISVVYGGAKIGLMGAVANGALHHQGLVIGVLPHFLRNREIVHDHLTELHLVDTMHQRKTKMDELSDGIIMLPGGFGTLEEFFEMLTWAQLGLHQKPVAVLNTNGYYTELLLMIQTMVDKGFLKQVNQDMVLVSDNIEELISKMANYEAPKVGKWITKSEV